MMSPQAIEDYWQEEKLDDCFVNLQDDSTNAIALDKTDLVRIHRLIRKRKCFTVLEFGVGYSTAIIADALSKNKQNWSKLEPAPLIRNRFMFQCFSVDTSADWIDIAHKRMAEPLRAFVQCTVSRVEIGTFNGQLCHFYKSVPDVIPDFIYLDGPDPAAVEGQINGLSFQCKERTVMSGDLLLMEPTMLPGTFILIDGRTNNARFLANNWKRNFEINWDRQGDVTMMELREERLGKYNLLGSDFFH